MILTINKILNRPETGHVVDQSGLSHVVDVQKVKILIFCLQELEWKLLEVRELNYLESEPTFGMLRKTETSKEGRI